MFTRLHGLLSLYPTKSVSPTCLNTEVLKYLTPRKLFSILRNKVGKEKLKSTSIMGKMLTVSEVLGYEAIEGVLPQGHIMGNNQSE